MIYFNIDISAKGQDGQTHVKSFQSESFARANERAAAYYASLKADGLSPYSYLFQNAWCEDDMHFENLGVWFNYDPTSVTAGSFMVGGNT